MADDSGLAVDLYWRKSCLLCQRYMEKIPLMRSKTEHFIERLANAEGKERVRFVCNNNITAVLEDGRVIQREAGYGRTHRKRSLQRRRFCCYDPTLSPRSLENFLQSLP